MNNTKEKVSLIAGIALMIQAITMFVLFLTQIKRRRGLAAAFLGISAVGGAIGAKLLSGFCPDDEEEDGEAEADSEHTDDDGNGVDDDLEIDDDMMRADLGHGTDDEEQSTN